MYVKEMRRVVLLLLVLAACSPAPGKLSVRISADAALSQTLTTEDGWQLTFTHAVVSLGSFAVSDVFKDELTASKLIDFVQTRQLELATNANVFPTTYPSISATVARRSSDENVNVPSDLVSRMGASSIWVEGTASKQSTTRTFQLGTATNFTFESCKPTATVEPGKEAVVDLRVRPQRVFDDDEGKMRFEAWGISDAFPQDGKVVGYEAGLVMTSTLPAAQYGATQGSLMTVFEKRLFTLMGVGDSGTCSGR
jgi:hypothetical protein